MCCFIDSVWSRCTPRYVTVVWKGMQLPSISADSQPTELIRTTVGSSGHGPTYTYKYRSMVLGVSEPVWPSGKAVGW